VSAVDHALGLVRLGTVNPPGTHAVVAGLLELRLTAPGWMSCALSVGSLRAGADAPCRRRRVDVAAIESVVDACAGVACRW
jgi:hypothetical protein